MNIALWMHSCFISGEKVLQATIAKSSQDPNGSASAKELVEIIDIAAANRYLVIIAPWKLAFVYVLLVPYIL